MLLLIPQVSSSYIPCSFALNSTTLFSLVFNQLTLSASGFSHVSKRTAVLVDVTLSRQTTWCIITPINYYAFFAGCVLLIDFRPRTHNKNHHTLVHFFFISLFIFIFEILLSRIRHLKNPNSFRERLLLVLVRTL